MAQILFRILCQSLDLVYLICVFVIYFSFSASFSLVLIIQRHWNRRTCFLYIFKRIYYYFWMIKEMKKANILQISRVQSQGVA